MNIFKRLFYGLRLRKAVQLADQAHLADGERYYVVPSTEKGIKLIVLNRRNFRLLKQKHYVSRNARVITLDSECFYATPYRNGSRTPSQFELELRAQAYFSWVEQKLAADKPKPKEKPKEQEKQQELQSKEPDKPILEE
jgi:hypothetical protein